MNNIKSVRANMGTIAIVLLVVGVITAIGSAGVIAWGTWNWSKSYNGTFEFAINDSSQESEWVNIGGQSEIKTAQTEGTSDCKYSLYCKKRYGSYDTVYNNLTYSKNNKATSAYSYNFGNIYDYKFKMKKQAGTSTYSTVEILVGIE
ncbi:hypothetical protein [Anaeromicropila populeti]|uniref:SipW-cognate class signal peptide n=1 Tax=Anaeromicropila populeti TaxID=37658 RepID=A0A1I6JS81_9FIRM|nr:hypothetical protein [Anaeromicropila populeti]SFR81781.1 hypothetical protein SAMN05661086_01937 [Anaeromicropila populeti]